MNILRRSILAFLAVASLALAEMPPPLPGYWAVACVPSHGGSATFIATFPPDADHPQGVSYLLSCAHLLEDGGADKSISITAPATSGRQQPIRCRPRFVASDKQVDLSLICMDYGPVPYVTPVAPRGHRVPNAAVSCGYDHLRWPGRRDCVSIFQITATEIWTHEKPIPGRSGGGLLDPQTGHVIGVCLARIEIRGNPSAGRGVFCSLAAIHRFLDAKGYGWLIPEARPAATPVSPPPR
jgi:hypothetical protein